MSPSVGDKGTTVPDGCGGYLFLKAATPTLNDKGSLINVPGSLPVFIKTPAPAPSAKGTLVDVPGSLPVFTSSVATPAVGTLVNYWVPQGNFGIYEGSGEGIWVTDGNRTVTHYTSSGSFVAQFTTSGYEQTDLVVDTAGNVYLISQYDVSAYSPAGVLIKHWSINGGFPNRIAIDGDNNLYVPNGPSIDIYSTSGTLLNSFLYASGNSAVISGIAVDGAGNVYLASDYPTEFIARFNSGSYSQAWVVNTVGSGNGQINSPCGITVDSTLGYVYISDFGNLRIQVFTGAGIYKAQWNSFYMNSILTYFSQQQASMFDLTIDQNHGIYIGWNSYILKFQGLTT